MDAVKITPCLDIKDGGLAKDVLKQIKLHSQRLGTSITYP